MEKSLRIKLGSNYQLIVETKVNDINESPFKNVYFKAFELVDEIIFNGEAYINQDSKSYVIPYTYNNIIAFTGDRGVGKTSAKVTFSNMLKNQIVPNSSKSDFVENVAFKNKSFYLTKIVDPSLFNDNSNIMEVVISHLFSNLIDELKGNGCNINESDKSAVISAFEKVFKNVKTTIKTKNEIYRDDPIEALMSLSSASDLQKNMQDLIKKYLKFVNKDFLVIQIDDIDLHTKQAHEMAEMLRKYLTQPNVIVLMALNPEQLEEVVYQQFLNDYKGILDTLKSDNFESERKINEIRGITTRYMEKFLPVDRRIHLPTLKELAINSSVILYCKNNDKEIYCERDSLEELIMELIYVKTGLITYESERHTYLFMPKNLREFIYLVEKLVSMQTIKLTSYVRAIKIIEVLKSKFIFDLSSLNDELNSDGIAKKISTELKSRVLCVNGLLKLRMEDEKKMKTDIEDIYERCKTSKLICNEIELTAENFTEGCIDLLGSKETLAKCCDNYKKFVEEVTEFGYSIKNSKISINKTQLGEVGGIFLKWCKENLTIAENGIVIEFLEMPIEYKNKFIIKHLGEQIDKELSKLSILNLVEAEDDEEKEIEIVNVTDVDSDDFIELSKIFHREEYHRIINRINTPENISFGDVNYLLKLYQILNPNSATNKFIYALRVCYNSLLLKYDLTDEKTEKNDYSTKSDKLKLLGGSFYNPVAEKAIRNRTMESKDKLRQKYYNLKANRNLDLIKWEGSLLLDYYYLQIRDFKPAVKMRVELKAGPFSNKSLEFFTTYFERYRIMSEEFYQLSIPKSGKKAMVYDVLGFMFNLHRVESFKEAGVKNICYNDLIIDYQQIMNVFVINQLMSQLKSELKTSFKDNKTFLNMIRNNVKMDYNWIEFNEFKDMNFLKYISEMDINEITTFIDLKYISKYTFDAETEIALEKMIYDFSVLIEEEKEKEKDVLSKLAIEYKAKGFSKTADLVALIGKYDIASKSWEETGSLNNLIKKEDYNTIESLSLLIDEARVLYVKSIKDRVTGTVRTGLDKKIARACHNVLKMY